MLIVAPCGAASPSLEKRGLSSLEKISMQRDIEMRFCNQWQSNISTVWDRTLSSKRTTLAPQGGVYQRLPPECGSGEDGMAC